MRFHTYSKFSPEAADAVDLQALLDKLADFLLQSGFAGGQSMNPYFDDFDSEPDRSVEALRQAILDALRGDQNVVFQVHYLKVHHGWCWIDTTPLDKQGRATAEGGPNLLHLENGTWKVLDLSKVPDDPDDPLGPEDASPGFVKNVLKTFPGVPRDIFPKPTK